MLMTAVMSPVSLAGPASSSQQQLQAAHHDGLPSYHYGAPIHVQCMNRSSSVPDIPPHDILIPPTGFL